MLKMHQAFLLQSVTLPHIIAAEIAARKQRDLIAEIGRLHIAQETVSSPSSQLLGDTAEAGS